MLLARAFAFVIILHRFGDRAVLFGKHQELATRRGLRDRLRYLLHRLRAIFPIMRGTQDLQDLWHVEVPFSLRSRKGACWSVLA